MLSSPFTQQEYGLSAMHYYNVEMREISHIDSAMNIFKGLNNCYRYFLRLRFNHPQVSNNWLNSMYNFFIYAL